MVVCRMNKEHHWRFFIGGQVRFERAGFCIGQTFRIDNQCEVGGASGLVDIVHRFVGSLTISRFGDDTR